MNDKIYLTRQDDTLRYRAIAQRTLAQETVCASIHVALLVSATQTDQSELQRQIREALNRFIPSVDWVISTLKREANPTVGYEQINVTGNRAGPIKDCLLNLRTIGKLQGLVEMLTRHDTDSIHGDRVFSRHVRQATKHLIGLHQERYAVRVSTPTGI